MIALLRRLFHDRRAVISLELTVMSIVLVVPITAGAVDAGELTTARARLDQVLHQALFYAYNTGSAVTTANINTYALQAAGTGTAPSVSSTITQYCIAPATGYPATGTPPTPANNACASSSLSIESYAAVTVTLTVTLSFTVPWVSKTRTLTVSGKARVA